MAIIQLYPLQPCNEIQHGKWKKKVSVYMVMSNILEPAIEWHSNGTKLTHFECVLSSSINLIFFV